jgi:hypothetical protein
VARDHSPSLVVTPSWISRAVLREVLFAAANIQRLAYTWLSILSILCLKNSAAVLEDHPRALLIRKAGRHWAVWYSVSPGGREELRTISGCLETLCLVSLNWNSSSRAFGCFTSYVKDQELNKRLYDTIILSFRDFLRTVNCVECIQLYTPSIKVTWHEI